MPAINPKSDVNFFAVHINIYNERGAEERRVKFAAEGYRQPWTGADPLYAKSFASADMSCVGRWMSPQNFLVAFSEKSRFMERPFGSPLSSSLSDRMARRKEYCFCHSKVGEFYFINFFFLLLLLLQMFYFPVRRQFNKSKLCADRNILRLFCLGEKAPKENSVDS
ncbi:hypothetical protein CDAR_184401 [Caerostris darwini]|uniref:Uncharacterized protein n=1 Tax=Caerostris darwini TaxID=1538125 RepID=A0AAV4UG47_9ARAC|nr:hypothetical protein CDAR_184401 [Caerostris darwini]